MPLYSYKCPTCHLEFSRILPLKDYREPQQCVCGKVAERVIEAPAVRGDYPGYNCPITNKWIEGRRAHEENLKRHGCRVLESGETSAVSGRVQREEAALEASIEKTAEEFITSLPAVKREKLAGEMEGGISATVVRQ
jgi:putative FmdB family regulatory protein